MPNPSFLHNSHVARNKCTREDKNMPMQMRMIITTLFFLVGCGKAAPSATSVPPTPTSVLPTVTLAPPTATRMSTPTTAPAPLPILTSSGGVIAFTHVRGRG
jgi:hypothetical protein